MNDYREMLKSIYVDLRLDEESEEEWPSERMMAWKHEIEKIFDQDELDLAYERFVKTDCDVLYKGAKVVVKRHIPYSEVFNDSDNDTGSFSLEQGMKGEIVEVGTDLEADPTSYWDCTVGFYYGAIPVLCRVEWLDFLDQMEDDEDDED